jgi:hypothetical protein
MSTRFDQFLQRWLAANTGLLREVFPFPRLSRIPQAFPVDWFLP